MEASTSYQKSSLFLNIKIERFLVPPKIPPRISGSEEYYRIGDLVQIYKTFYGRNLRIFIISKSVCTCQAFLPSLMFAVKAGAYPSEALFTRATLGKAPGLTYKH